MGLALKQSTASQEIPLGYFVDSTDGDTEETGLTIANTDIKLWKNGATTLANKNSGGATHISNGIYYAVLDATDTDTVGPMVIFCHVSGALTVRLECHVYEEDIYDAIFGASAAGFDSNQRVSADVVAISGDTTAADNAEAFFDDTGFAASNSTIGTCTTNTDMRGTDSAATASALTTHDGKLDTVDTNVDAILVDTADMQPKLGTPAGASISADIAALENISAADVNAQVVDVIRTDTVSELSGVPAASPNLHAMIQWLYMKVRNKETSTASAATINNDAGTAVGTSTLSDDGTTFTKGEYS